MLFRWKSWLSHRLQDWQGKGGVSPGPPVLQEGLVPFSKESCGAATFLLCFAQGAKATLYKHWFAKGQKGQKMSFCTCLHQTVSSPGRWLQAGEGHSHRYKPEPEIVHSQRNDISRSRRQLRTMTRSQTSSQPALLTITYRTFAGTCHSQAWKQKAALITAVWIQCCLGLPEDNQSEYFPT